MGAPSVLQLADEGEIAVHAAVEADEVWTLLPALKDAGATSILVLPVERLVAVRATLDDALGVAAPIVADVRERGDAALLEWTERLDGPRPGGLRVPAGASRRRRVDDDVLEALRAMIVAVTRFSEAQRPADTRSRRRPGSSPSDGGCRCERRAVRAGRATPLPRRS